MLAHAGEVSVDDLLGIAAQLDFGFVDPQRLVGHLLDEAEAVGHEDDGLVAAAELADLVEALVNEGLVTHREHFVDQENIRIDVDRNREPEAHVHAGGVSLDRSIDELLELSELHDVVEAIVDFLFRQPQHDAVDEDVLAAGDLGMKAGAELDERGDATVHRDRPRVGFRDPGNDFEKGALPGAVSPDNRERRSLADVERSPR